MLREKAVEEALSWFDSGRPWWCRSKQARQSAERAIGRAYDHGLSFGEPGRKNKHSIKGVIENHKSLFATLIAVVTAASGSAALTTTYSPWIAPVAALVGSIFAAIFRVATRNGGDGK